VRLGRPALRGHPGRPDLPDRKARQGGLSTATFALCGGAVTCNGGNADLNGDQLTKVVSKTLLAGNYSVWGIVNLNEWNPNSGEANGDAHCELRIDNSFIGGATDRKTISGNDSSAARTIMVFGGAVAKGGGSEINLWCSSQFLTEPALGSLGSQVIDAAIMAITVGSFPP
jgi:hypothetical protein